MLGRHRSSALTAAVLALASGLSPAAVTVTGSYTTGPGALPVGPGNTDLGPNGLTIGSGGVGDLLVDAGSSLSATQLNFAGGGTGVGSGLLTGVGSWIALTADPTQNRLQVGNWGQGQLTVAAGATLDGRSNAAACQVSLNGCHSFIGNGAGSDGRLTITGAGSKVSLLRSFVVANLNASPPNFGTAGANTSGRVDVLDGGLLVTDRAYLAVGPSGTGALGSERSVAAVSVDGAGSVWRVTPGTVEGGAAFIVMATHANATASLTLSHGGQVQLQGQANTINVVDVGTVNGKATLSITGSGSALSFSGDAGVLQVGYNGSDGQAVLGGGGVARGMFYTSVGRDGGKGQLLVDGVGSRLLIDGTASAAANGLSTGPVLDIGRSAKNAVVTVQNGGRIDLVATQSFAQGTAVNIARDAGSSGTLNLVGAGSVLSISSASVLPGGGPGEALNPVMRVGREGSGALNITAGAKLLMDGGAVSTVANSRSTSLLIGGVSDVANGGSGTALVSGAGSEIRLTGSDTYIGVGHGPQSQGHLSVMDQASVSAIGMNVGRFGGVGVVDLDHASLSFSGQQTGSTLSGAFLSIGRSGGTGTVNLGNASVVTLSNPGNLGASVGLGGTSNGPLGDGRLFMSGGSLLSLQAAPGLASLTVGRDGTGLMAVQGSTVDVAGGNVYVGRLAGASGNLLLSDGASLTAAWVGIGRNRSGNSDVDGGSGSLIVNASTLTADTLVIGSHGYLGGSGLIVGNVVNHGVFNPGNSPGTMRIDGGFSAASDGTLILEVEADGHGGFKTDSLVFGSGTSLDLAHLNVQFRFLGATDPNAFQASGQFNVDHFFTGLDAQGQAHGVDHQNFSGASFSALSDHFAIQNFSFTADGGAHFVAQAVPEPTTFWMLLAGGAVLGFRARCQRGRG